MASYYETFYDDWLAMSERMQRAYDDSPVIAHDRDIRWVRTVQDAKVKLLIANELGFPTMGSVLTKGEIPPGWHTGQHRHGEESILILQGEGFSVIDGDRFDWRQHTALQIPYRAAHQHFNTGDGPAQYLSAMCLPLEAFVYIAGVEQFGECGPNDPGAVAKIPAQQSQYQSNGRRVAIHVEDSTPGTGREMGLEAYPNRNLPSKALVTQRNGFREPLSVAMTHIFSDPPGYKSGSHKHLEAMLYVLEGEGYSDVRGKRAKWVAGDAFHVPPSMAEHQHFNDSGQIERMVRIGFGIRSWFTDIWPEGYTVQRTYDKDGKPILPGEIERVRERS